MLLVASADNFAGKGAVCSYPSNQELQSRGFFTALCSSLAGNKECAARV